MTSFSVPHCSSIPLRYPTKQLRYPTKQLRYPSKPLWCPAKPLWCPNKPLRCPTKPLWPGRSWITSWGCDRPSIAHTTRAAWSSCWYLVWRRFWELDECSKRTTSFCQFTPPPPDRDHSRWHERADNGTCTTTDGSRTWPGSVPPLTASVKQNWAGYEPGNCWDGPG